MVTIDIYGSGTVAPTITIAIAHPVYGDTQPFTFTMLRAAFALVARCTEPDDHPAAFAVRENALPGGWFIIDEHWSGTHFGPVDLEHVVWLAQALVEARDAETTAATKDPERDAAGGAS